MLDEKAEEFVLVIASPEVATKFFNGRAELKLLRVSYAIPRIKKVLISTSLYFTFQASNAPSKMSESSSSESTGL